MGDVINLRRVRKQRARDEASSKADRNRRLFGRTAAEKAAEVAEHARIEKTINGAKLENLTPDRPSK